MSRAAANEASPTTTPDPPLTPGEQLRAGIDAYVRYAEEHSQGFLTAWRGSLAGDLEVRAIGEEARRRQSARILDVVIGDADPPPLLRLAVHGWIAFAQDVIAHWLEDRATAREAVCDLLTKTLVSVIEATAKTNQGR